MVRSSKKAGKRHRGVLEAAEPLVVKLYKDEAQLSRQRRASAVGGSRGNGGRGSIRSRKKPDRGIMCRLGNMRSRRKAAGDESTKETADRVAQHQADYQVVEPRTTAAGSNVMLLSFLLFLALFYRSFVVLVSGS